MQKIHYHVFIVTGLLAFHAIASSFTSDSPTAALSTAPIAHVEYLTDAYIDIASSDGQRFGTILGSAIPKATAIPRREDTFVLSLHLGNELFLLELSPHSNLVAPNAVVVVHRNEGREMNLLVPKVYSGRVLTPVLRKTQMGVSFPWNELNYANSLKSWDDDMDEVGHATILLSHNETYKSQFIHPKLAREFLQDIPTFRGHLRVRGVSHYIQPVDTYRRFKREVDIDIEPSYPDRLRRRRDGTIYHGNPMMVTWKDNDRLDSPEFLAMQHLFSPGRCGYGDARPSPEVKAGLKQRDSNHQDVFDRAADSALRRRLSELRVPVSLLNERVSSGCPTTSSQIMLYMVAVADCTYVSAHGTVQQAQDAILATWATVSDIFATTFNIPVGLVQVQVFASCGTLSAASFNRACGSDYSITQRLSDFSYWRGTETSNTSAIAGLYHLMTNCPTGSQVGVAWLNTLCQKTAFSQTDSTYGKLYVNGCGVSSIPPNQVAEYKVVAHEIGHNFGSIHDCDSSTCKGANNNPSSSSCCQCNNCSCNSQYLMNPYDNAQTNTFSTCSQGLICSKIGSLGRCLDTPGKYSTVSKFVCGNGIREGSEQCDCGGAASCANDPCCTSNCTLKAGALCSPKQDTCCTQTCQLLPKGRVCRNSTGHCDTPEFCDGNNPSCPTDVFLQNGTPCNGTDTQFGDLKCANGICTNADKQCSDRNPSITLINSTTTQQYITGRCTKFGRTCSMFCTSLFGECFPFDGSFLPGTDCGNGGVCLSDGTCTNPDLITLITEWVRSNTTIVIPMAIVAFLLLVAGMSWALRRPKFSRKRIENQILSIDPPAGSSKR